MKSIDKKFKIWGKRFSLTGIFSSGRIPASFEKVITVISFFLFIFVLTLSSSSPLIAWLKPSAKIENYLSIQVRPPEPLSVQTFLIKFMGHDKFHGFFFETEANKKIKKDRRQRLSERPGAREPFLEEIMLWSQGKINQGRLINDYPGFPLFPEAFESEPGETGCELLALSLKKKGLTFKPRELLREDQEKGKEGEAEGKEELIKPEFKNIKERISVYAFLAWIWLVIGVLLYILNEQIKEAERRRRLGL